VIIGPTPHRRALLADDYDLGTAKPQRSLIPGTRDPASVNLSLISLSHYRGALHYSDPNSSL